MVVGAEPEFSVVIARHPKGVVAAGGRANVAPHPHPVVVQNIGGGFKQGEILGVRRTVIEIIGVVAQVLDAVAATDVLPTLVADVTRVGTGGSRRRAIKVIICPLINCYCILYRRGNIYRLITNANVSNIDIYTSILNTTVANCLSSHCYTWSTLPTYDVNI